MQPFSHHHTGFREQHIYKQNYEILVVQENHISRLELKRCFLEFIIFFSKAYTVFGIWTEVWILRFGIM
jgi:hypothetical protein